VAHKERGKKALEDLAIVYKKLDEERDEWCKERQRLE